MHTPHSAHSEPSVNEDHVIQSLRKILQDLSPHSLPQLVVRLYKSDAKFKDYFQNTLKISVKTFLLQNPSIFEFDEENCTVTLAKELPKFSAEEVSKHCTKDDAWIALDGQVYDITEFVRTHWGWTSAGNSH
jgi:cytochrome b involved in lipid metabolism